MAVLAVDRQIDRIAVLLERGLELVAEGRLVFDDQDAHQKVPSVCQRG